MCPTGAQSQQSWAGVLRLNNRLNRPRRGSLHGSQQGVGTTTGAAPGPHSHSSNRPAWTGGNARRNRAWPRHNHSRPSPSERRHSWDRGRPLPGRSMIIPEGADRIVVEGAGAIAAGAAVAGAAAAGAAGAISAPESHAAVVSRNAAFTRQFLHKRVREYQAPRPRRPWSLFRPGPRSSSFASDEQRPLASLREASCCFLLSISEMGVTALDSAFQISLLAPRCLLLPVALAEPFAPLGTDSQGCPSTSMRSTW